MAEEATAAGASTARRDMENQIAEGRGITSPRKALRHHHPVREAEAEGQNLTPAPLLAGGVYEILGNA
jgi:hypothetical protein